MKNKTKKIAVLIILGIYLLTNFLQSGLYVGNKVYAANTGNTETQRDYTNIVAIIVNDKIYNNSTIKDHINWYATKYIQGKENRNYTAISNSKALVFPIDVDNFSTKNIAQLLENMYFDGIQGETSKLVGLVLIGDIPLPVVNQDGYIYPTIYPYVDFEEQKFIWDEESKYFVYNKNSKGQAEIWHGMINFGENIEDYDNYFKKLKKYRVSPSDYADKAIWYEDFIGNNKYFNDNSLNFYLNNFIFAEDLGYHRYSNLLVKVLQGQRNSEMAAIMESLNEVNGGVDLSGMDLLAELDDNMNIPTSQIKTMLDNGYLASYSSLFGQKYLKTITNNVETANRWVETRTGSSGEQYYLNAFDSLYKKAEVTDEVLLRREGGLEPFLIMVNNALEEAVDKKVEEEKYRLDEVIPLTYLKYEGRTRTIFKKCVWQIYDAYENFFFGTNAKYAQNMEEASLYRGTFRNYLGIDGLTISGIQASENPSTDVKNLDLNKKSIGGSYEIFAQQVEANRGYNYNNSTKELDIYDLNKVAVKENWDVTCVKKFLGICIKRRRAVVSTNGSGCDLSSEDGDQGGCESPTEYAIRNRGGASPLNLDIDGSNYSRKSGYNYTGASSSIFDIAGSLALPINKPEYESNSFLAVNKYSNLILRRFSPDTEEWPKYKSGNPTKKAPDSYGIGYDYSMDYDVKFTNMVPMFSEKHVTGWRRKSPLTADDVDYFDKYNRCQTKRKEGNIIKLKKTTGGGDESCQGAGEIYTYKTLDSRVKNDSVNADEINGKTYKVFQDDVSHVKQFYNELVSYVDAVSGSVSSLVGNGNDSLKTNLIKIKRSITNINEGFDDIKDFNIRRVRDMDTGAVIAKANEWSGFFNSSKATELIELEKKAQDNVVDLKGFVEVGDTLFDGVIDYINEQKNVFKVNGRDLIFLKSWKNNLFTAVKDVLENYEKINLIIVEANGIYITIGKVGKRDTLLGGSQSFKYLEDLTDKKEFLEDELDGSGCQTKYSTMCETLDSLIYNFNHYVDTINDGKDGINNLKLPKYNDNGEPVEGEYEEIEDVLTDLMGAAIFGSIGSVKNLISHAIAGSMPQTYGALGGDDPLVQLFNSLYSIPETSNEELLGVIPGINMTTADRPIDSPRYLTFKGISGDKVTFIYPDIYKAEIFSGDSNILQLKSTGEIEKAIKSYLKGVVAQYNEYLSGQKSQYSTYYNGNKNAFDLLNTLDPLASPNHVGDDVRPYHLFSENYLIEELEKAIRESDFFPDDEELANANPIGFIASMIYYQNITWQAKSLSGTIQGDFDNQRQDFDINEKVSYLMDNYLVADKYQGRFLTPDYRSGGYEVAYINSDGNDRILYENTPDIVNAVNSASTSYTRPNQIDFEAIPLEEQLSSECNIPMDGGVLIFSLENGRITSPWRDALKCRWNQIKEKPLEFKITLPFNIDTSASFLENLGDIFNWGEYEEIGATYQNYADQYRLLDMDSVNEEIIGGLEESNSQDLVKLQEILSYTLVNPNKSIISADSASGEINIESSKDLGEVDFYIVNVGASKIKLYDGEQPLAGHITAGTGGFSTGILTFNPYYPKTLKFEVIDEPIVGLNVVVLSLCLPGTQTCVKKSFRLNIVPGEVKNVKIELERHLVLEGATLPFKVKGTDKFGNQVGELVSQKFETFVDTGLLALNGVKAPSIKFGNFNKTNYTLIATGGDLDGKNISIQVSGSIDDIKGVKDTEYVLVKKGRLDTYSGNMKIASGSDIIAGLEIKLPDSDIYFTMSQPNTGALPRLTFKLFDKDNNIIDIDGKLSIKTKNNRLTPGIIVSKEVGDGEIQYKFNKTKTFTLSGGICDVYLYPNFTAGEEILYVSMEGVDDVEIPVVIKHASPKVLSLSADKTLLNTNSSTDGKLTLFDNRGNIINDDQTIYVVLGSADDKLSLSKSGTQLIPNGYINFEINTHDKGGLGHIYAYIHTGIVPMNRQSPATLAITIQEKMLPEKDLNVMYLSLFGNDRGNQWGYMSDNKQYSESLIKNSDKLLTITTQLLGLENIKYYSAIIDSGLQINNLIGNDITFKLSTGFIFDINEVGTISVKSNGFTFGGVERTGALLEENLLEEYITSLITTGKYKNKNVLLYIPEQPDSIITSNDVLDRAIYINGHKVFDIRTKTFSKNLTILLGEEKFAGYQVWDVFFDDNRVGRMLFVVNKKNEISIDLNPQSPDYWFGSTWINGSSNDYGLGFYEVDSSLPTKTFGYKSIQDSYNAMLGIGFTADFKNITNFGGGMPVGEATLPFSSELLINIGDPLLKRMDGNESAKVYDNSGNVTYDTEFDLGLGEVIYSDPNKEIYKVTNIDFNNDKLEDILVIYKDGTVNLLKNYGGTNPFQNLGPLMTLADRISEVSVGDVDGNGYEDLLIRTQGGVLRVYLNHNGIFDVDGYPVCLNVNVNKGEISEHPEKVSGIHQIFLKDMDLDGAMDIVTNDKYGFIKIFYGGSTDGAINYVSQSKYMCDYNWYNRIKDNTKIVYQFGVKIDSSVHVLDQSLIRWAGISEEEKPEPTADDLGVDDHLLENPDEMTEDDIEILTQNVTHIDISAAENIYKQGERLKKAGFDVIPVYESGIDNATDIDYVEIGSLTGADPVKIYKTYEDMNHNPVESNLVDTNGALSNGDMVRVTVYIEANDDFVGTFIDRISGPRIIPLSEYDDSTFENFWFDYDYVENGYVTEQQIDDMTENIHWDLDNARYMIDNIKMRRGNKLKFSYGLIYNEYNVFNIDIDTLSGDNFSGLVYPTESLANYSNDNVPDISVQPTDGCNDSMFIFFNNSTGSRTYAQKFMDLGKITAEYNENANESLQGTIDDTTQSLVQAKDGGSQQVYDTVLEMAGGLLESIDWKGMLSSQGLDLTNLANTPNQFIDALSNNLVNKIDDIVGSACNGIGIGSLAGGCKIPVPFNWALLGVGDYKLFGCYDVPFLSRTIGKGFPIVSIPGNYGPTVAGYIPAPGVLGGLLYRGPGDSFFGFPQSGTYPSMFRIYVMPTLTAKIGFAFCFGPFGVGKAIKDPVGSIAGNCIVFAVDPCIGKSGNGDNSAGPNSTTDVPYPYTLLKGCNKQNNPTYLLPGESFSPFVFGGSSSYSNSFQPIIPGGSYAGGFINIEVSPETHTSYTEAAPLDMEAIILEGGASVQNTIRGSKEQGLIQKIVKQWLDKQIKYIMTQLTNFKISVAWPDFAGVIGKAPSPSSSNANKDQDELKKQCDQIKGQRLEGQAARDMCDSEAYCCLETNESEKLKCENRGRERDSANKKCLKKTSQNFEEESLASIDTWTQQNLLSREQIASWSDYKNPFKELEEAFSETKIININTQDITLNIPMITSEDITSYISMSKSWMDRQKEILENWKQFFKSVIGVCGGSTNINGIDDLGNAINDLKEQYKDARAYSQGGDDDKLTENLEGKINALEKLKNNYNLSALGDYNVYEAEDGGFYVYVKYSDIDAISPYDVYLYFDPSSSNLSMFTSGFDLVVTNASSNSTIGKSKISIQRNKQRVSNDGLAIKKEKQGIYHTCAEMFLDGTIDSALNGFMNLQSSADSLMFSVKENMETLQQYKLFPLQLYDWIHVEERYLGEISNLVNSVLGTLSVWMETNANRFSQYVDAIITIMTALETYQLIIDLSADWTENCSSCTNDNYDQFSCKLGKICDLLNINLPIIEVPSTKVPSFYIDFSEIHISMDVKLPNLVFNTTSIPLPELPNLPNPPKIDISANLDDILGAGLDELIQNIKAFDFSKLSSINLGSIPLLPSPPTLPELPSIMPEIEMELPLLPPAPKIPELPSQITTAIKGAKIIGKILCIVKGKFGLVAENSIKAKVEQITERDYEIPFRDNLDLTTSDWNTNPPVEMNETLAKMFTGLHSFLVSDQFKDVKLKGFDISLQTYVNLQFNFDFFYTFLEGVVNNINSVSYKITDFVSDKVDDFSAGLSKEFAERLKACTNNPISVECNPEAAALIKQHQELEQSVLKYSNLLEESSSLIGIILTQKENKENRIQELQKEIDNLLIDLGKHNEALEKYNNELNSTYIESYRKTILRKIEDETSKINDIQDDIDKYNAEIEELEQEVADLVKKHGEALKQYSKLKELYKTLSGKLETSKNSLIQQSLNIITQINNKIKEAGEILDPDRFKKIDDNINTRQSETETKTQQDKQKRSDNLQDLFKEITDGPTISYVDYDENVNNNNINVLTQALSEIQNETNNKDIKNRAQEYLSLITMNKKINANTNAIDDVQRKYDTIIDDHKNHNDEIIDLIDKDYDKFLGAISNGDTTLVSSNKPINLTLSANLFDMNKEAVQTLSNQENWIKKYIDYNVKNVKGYLDALDNFDAKTLNMSDNEYKLSKSYLEKIKSLSDKAYDIIDGKTDNTPILLAQSAGGGGGNTNPLSASNTIDIANYIDGYSINTEEGSFLLANEDYVNKFQSRFLLTDINGDFASDLIMWDQHNVYIKYRKDNSSYSNAEYDNSSNAYVYYLKSYEKLLSDSKDGYVKIKNNLMVKLLDTNREVKNFKYAGETFDTIKVSWSNNSIMGDVVDGYLVRMIHRVDQFNDNEALIGQGNNEELFNKKYVLVLPKGSQVTGTKLKLEKETLTNIERFIGTGDIIFSVLYYNEGDETINLTISDIPRNWQYSEIYTLNFEDNTYKISSSSSNQVVAGPQIIADTQGPDPDVKLYRPATDMVVSEGISLQGYVGTNYILQVYWEDNVAMDEMRIFDTNGNTGAVKRDVNNKTGYIELTGLYFTGEQSLTYYILGEDINGNHYSTDINLLIKTPSIEITNILKGNQNLSYVNGFVGFSPSTNIGGIPSAGDEDSIVTVVAELETDIDSGFVQFFGNRYKDLWNLLTGDVQRFSVPSFKVGTGITKVYGGNFSIGDDIGLYSASGDVVGKINPKNGKITKTPGYGNIDIKLDYSAKRPLIKVMEGDKVIFWIIYSGKELIDIIEYSDNLSIEKLDKEEFGSFMGGKAIIMNEETLLYVSPKGDIYTEATLYGEYSFDDDTESVIYSFRTTPTGDDLGSVQLKIKSLIDD